MTAVIWISGAYGQAGGSVLGAVGFLWDALSDGPFDIVGLVRWAVPWSPGLAALMLSETLSDSSLRRGALGFAAISCGAYFLLYVLPFLQGPERVAELLDDGPIYLTIEFDQPSISEYTVEDRDGTLAECQSLDRETVEQIAAGAPSDTGLRGLRVRGWRCSATAPQPPEGAKLASLSIETCREVGSKLMQGYMVQLLAQLTEMTASAPSERHEQIVAFGDCLDKGWPAQIEARTHECADPTITDVELARRDEERGRELSQKCRVAAGL